jgi:hypothetical protein
MIMRGAVALGVPRAARAASEKPNTIRSRSTIHRSTPRILRRREFEPLHAEPSARLRRRASMPPEVRRADLRAIITGV